MNDDTTPVTQPTYSLTQTNPDILHEQIDTNTDSPEINVNNQESATRTPENKGLEIAIPTAAPPLIQVPNQYITGPFLEFQKPPVNLSFTMIRELSNLLSFTITRGFGETQTSKSYHFVVAKLFSSNKGSTDKDSPLNLPLYIGFVSELFQNDWQVFSGFHEITKHLEIIDTNNLSLMLQLAKTEMSLFMPNLKMGSGEAQKTFDISRVYPAKWRMFLKHLLSCDKGLTGYTLYNPPSEDNTAIGISDKTIVNRHKVFDPLPQGILDKDVDIYRSLATLQPFWITETSLQELSEKHGPNIKNYPPHYFANSPLVFSFKGDHHDGYVKCDLKPMTGVPNCIEEIAQNIFRHIKKSTLLSAQKDIKTYINPKVYQLNYLSIKNLKIPTPPLGMSLFKMASFFNLIKEKSTEIIETEKGDVSGIAKLKSIVEKADDLNGNDLKNIERLFNRLDSSRKSHYKGSEIYMVSNDFFSTFNLLSTEEMVALFQKQLIFIDSFSVQKKEKVQSFDFDVPISFTLKMISLFSNFHDDAISLGKNFEHYFEKLKNEKLKNIKKIVTTNLAPMALQEGKELNASKSYIDNVSDAEDNKDDDLTSGRVDLSDDTDYSLEKDLQERRIKQLCKDHKKEVINLYQEFQTIILDIRRIYPGFGYLPECMITEPEKKNEEQYKEIIITEDPTAETIEEAKYLPIKNKDTDRGVNPKIEKAEIATESKKAASKKAVRKDVTAKKGL